jgi:hypothetical protein
VAPTVYLAYAGPVSEVQRCWIGVVALRSVRRPAYLAGASALIQLGLRNITTPVVHVLLVARYGVRAPSGVVAHRVVSLPDEDVHPAPGLPMTLAGRAVVDAARWARSDDEARLFIAASFQQRLVSLPEITRVLDRDRCVHRHALIRRTAHDCADGSHSIGELDVLALCRVAHLPSPTRQASRRDRAGRQRYLDACFDPWRVAVEIDGGHHVDVGQMWDDSARQNDLSLDGYLVLRYPVHVVRDRPEQVITDVREALMARGWRPGR